MNQKQADKIVQKTINRKWYTTKDVLPKENHGCITRYSIRNQYGWLQFRGISWIDVLHKAKMALADADV